jgi:hypothetical protein
MFIVKFLMVIVYPIYFEHFVLLCLFLESHLTTYHSNRYVQLREITKKCTSTLDQEFETLTLATSASDGGAYSLM